MKFSTCNRLCFVWLVLMACLTAQAQEGRKNAVYRNSAAAKRGPDELRVMFYNVENLFDPMDDSLTADEEYTPKGIRGWTYNRLKRKQINIARVFLAVGGWDPPDLVGLCEIENRFVLSGLADDTPLKPFKYQIVHRESPDPRGIDVALMYRPEKFRVLSNWKVPVVFPFEPNSATRDILWVQGIVSNKDTLNVFVNHWPSKFSGAMATIAKRNFVGSLLRAKVDSLMKASPNCKILIMGDLNDTPADESVSKALGASTDSTLTAPNALYDLLGGAGVAWNRGTIKFHEEWEAIDHIIVNQSMMRYPGLKVKRFGLTIFDAPFLLQEDETWFGKKPFRTYDGMKYIGGFSDHLPVFTDITY